MSKLRWFLWCWKQVGQQLLLEKTTTINSYNGHFLSKPLIVAPLVQRRTGEYLAPAAVEEVLRRPQPTADGGAEEWGGCRAAQRCPAPRGL